MNFAVYTWCRWVDRYTYLSCSNIISGQGEVRRTFDISLLLQRFVSLLFVCAQSNFGSWKCIHNVNLPICVLTHAQAYFLQFYLLATYVSFRHLFPFLCIFHLNEISSVLICFKYSSTASVSCCGNPRKNYFHLEFDTLLMTFSRIQFYTWNSIWIFIIFFQIIFPDSCFIAATLLSLLKSTQNLLANRIKIYIRKKHYQVIHWVVFYGKSWVWQAKEWQQFSFYSLIHIWNY